MGTRTTITDEEYYNLMDQIEEEIADRGMKVNEEQISEEIEMDKILHGWHLAPQVEM